MPANPLIAFQAQVPDIGKTFSNVLTTVSQYDQLKRAREMAPIQQRAAEAQTQIAESKVPGAQQQFNEAELRKITSIGQGAREIIPDLQAGNINRVKQTLQARSEALIKAGIDNSDTQEALKLADSDPKELLRVSQNAVDLATKLTPNQASQFGAQQTFKDEKGNLFFGTTRRNPKTGEVQSVLASVTGDQSQPEGKVSLVSGLGLTATEKTAQAAQEAGAKKTAELTAEAAISPQIEKSKEIAKLSAQLKLKPEVDKAVKLAVSNADQIAKRAGEVRSAQTAWNVYNTGMEELSKALQGTTTGPFVGIVPAVTSNQQIADGAVAAIAPVMKQMFRSAGEGNFTDADQKLLMGMVPTRKDSPEARISKIKMIDAIVRAKLTVPEISQQATGIEQVQQQQMQPQTQQQQRQPTTETPSTGGRSYMDLLNQ